MKSEFDIPTVRGIALRFEDRSITTTLKNRNAAVNSVTGGPIQVRPTIPHPAMGSFSSYPAAS
jgi:hypothetical protein